MSRYRDLSPAEEHDFHSGVDLNLPILYILKRGYVVDTWEETRIKENE